MACAKCKMIGGVATFHRFAGRILGVISDSAQAFVATFNYVETRRHGSCFRRAWLARRRAQQRTGHRVLAGWRSGAGPHRRVAAASGAIACDYGAIHHTLLSVKDSLD